MLGDCAVSVDHQNVLRANNAPYITKQLRKAVMKKWQFNKLGLMQNKDIVVAKMARILALLSWKIGLCS